MQSSTSTAAAVAMPQALTSSELEQANRTWSKRATVSSAPSLDCPRRNGGSSRRRRFGPSPKIRSTSSSCRSACSA